MSEIAIFDQIKYSSRRGIENSRVVSAIRRLVPAVLVAILVLSCSSARRAAADERAALSSKLGVEITKDDKIKLYRYVSSWIGVRYRTGGTMSPADAMAKLEAGATLVQVFTGFIYYGPKLAKDVNKTVKNGSQK